MEHKSIWNKSDTPEKGELNTKINADISIVGAGMTGLISAHLLNKAGFKVVILEAEQVAGGTTGFSSCHLTTDSDFEYHEIISDFNEEKARIVAKSRVEAINMIESLVIEYNIECDFQRVNGYLYTEETAEISNIANEGECAKKVGLQVELDTKVPLPFPVKYGVLFQNQAQFNSYKFCQGMAEVLNSLGVSIYENSRVINIIENDDYCLVGTSKGHVTSKHVIVATHLPLLFNVLQTTSAPYRSYMIAAKLKDGEQYPEGLFWDSNDPYYYTRSYKNEEGNWLVAGGEDHKTGDVIDTAQHYKNLENYLTKRYKIDHIGYSWSAQYYEPVDGLPYIGKNPFSKNTYVATGFSGDGLVYGVVSGIIINDLIQGKENSWLSVFDARRFTPVASAKEFIKENLNVFKHFVKDRFNVSDDAFEDVLPDQGKIIEKDGEKYAVARDTSNELHVLSPVCPHLKCFVQWNNGEKSWDCPCHGSRFTISGEVICGPAVKNLENKRIYNLEN